MGEQANAVLQHPENLGPLDHSMQREALICTDHTGVLAIMPCDSKAPPPKLC